MTPIVKDPENAAVPSAPGSPSSVPARPQPVALEVPVTVNGARTVEGSDKREPFSEKSATVLVFGHGAVIRISAVLAPGQLVFLTNEKTRKEVVCQVVKSKTDGNAVGYVELRFTEPAPGFWGMRFPSDTVLPQAAARPVAPPPAPAAPKAAPPAPPVAAKPVSTSQVAPPAPVIAPPPVAGTPAPRVVAAPQIAEPKISIPAPVPSAPVVPPSIASQTPPVSPSSAALEAPPAPLASAPAAPIVESKTATPLISTPPPISSTPSTEELKQQAARLQEQLSSLLFTEAPKPAAPVATPKESVNTPEVAQKVLEPVSPASEAAHAKPIKVASPSPKLPVSSLDAEEIKIPAWLAPLARDTEVPPTAANPFHVDGTNSDVESVIPQASQEEVLSEMQGTSHRPETAVFGGQLLGESSQSVDAPHSKSKLGLFVGIAAGLLLIAGGVWYSGQPGNAISGLLKGSSNSAQPAASAPAASTAASEPAPTHAAEAPTPAPEPPRANRPVESVPAASAPVERASRNTNPVAASAAHNVQPPVEEPKKPSLGDVHLAAPVVSRGEAASSSAASAPALDINQAANTSTPVSGLSDTHRAQPVAPAPVGGDVKPAKLLHAVPPIYPEMARNQRISGNVQIDALIDAEGNVSSMKVLSGSPLLHEAALNALKQWKYQPAQLDGKPTSMHLTVTIQFRTQ